MEARAPGGIVVYPTCEPGMIAEAIGPMEPKIGPCGRDGGKDIAEPGKPGYGAEAAIVLIAEPGMPGRTAEAAMLPCGFPVEPCVWNGPD
mmetsp:Transcript_88300/g.230439  ORF Transcript_88300/g.230439 Transcript_88300/m.230439 type:complete len:90 (-) Transcript_88300:17-286(-)